MLAYAGLGRDCVGHMLAYVSPMLAYVGTILVHLGGYARHMLGICWGGYYLVPIPSPCSLLGRRPAVRRKPHKSGRQPRAHVLAGGLQLVTEGYIRSPPLPPTLLLDRPRGHPRSTSGRPQVESGRQIYMLSTSLFAHDVENIVFYSVSWPSADTTFA